MASLISGSSFKFKIPRSLSLTRMNSTEEHEADARVNPIRVVKRSMSPKFILNDKKPQSLATTCGTPLNRKPLFKKLDQKLLPGSVLKIGLSRNSTQASLPANTATQAEIKTHVVFQKLPKNKGVNLTSLENSITNDPKGQSTPMQVCDNSGNSSPGQDGRSTVDSVKMSIASFNVQVRAESFLTTINFRKGEAKSALSFSSYTTAVKLDHRTDPLSKVIQRPRSILRERSPSKENKGKETPANLPPKRVRFAKFLY